MVILGLLAGCSAEKKATKAFRLGRYQTTIDIFKQALAKNPDDARANYFVAESYRLSNRLKDAEPFYAKAGGRGVNADSVKFFRAESLEVNGKYDDARKLWDELSREAESDDMKERSQSKIAALDYLEKLNEKKSYYRVKNLELVNSPAAEY